MADATADAKTRPEDRAASPPVDNTAHAFERIRAAILTGELAPGTTLSQVQLAATLNVSRTPLREALRLLQNEGLIESDFNRRVRVSPLGIEDLEELYAMRIALEPLGARLTVPELDDAAVDRMTACLEDLDRAIETGVFDASRAPHRTFHLTLVSGLQRRMGRSVEDLWDHAERYRRLYQASTADRLATLQLAQKEHYAILAAAAERNANLCSRLIAEHLGRTALTVIAEVDQTHDPRRVREALRFVIGASE